MNPLSRILCSLAIALVVFSASANAGTIGDIQVFYNSSSNFGQGVLDGAVFVIQNTSGTAITNGVFSIGVGGDNGTADSFNVGTIAAGANFFIEPGISSDGGAGHTFFSVTSVIRDESDSGPSSNDVPFSFTGLQAALGVGTGTFTPDATKGPSNDGTISILNFLGGGPQSDGPCNDCFGPQIVATITTQTSTVPEPSTLILLTAGFCAIAVKRRLSRS